MWYRISKMGGNWYAASFDEGCLEYEVSAIESMVEGGTPVVIVDDLEWFCEEFNVDQDDIIMVDEEGSDIDG